MDHEQTLESHRIGITYCQLILLLVGDLFVFSSVYLTIKTIKQSEYQTARVRNNQIENYLFIGNSLELDKKGSIWVKSRFVRAGNCLLRWINTINQMKSLQKITFLAEHMILDKDHCIMHWILCQRQFGTF